MTKTLSITVISKACGISAPTLRIWEKRYNAFSPDRDGAGQRLYSEEDLMRAKLIAALLDKGHIISGVVNLSISELESKLYDGKVDSIKTLGKLETRRLLDSLEKFNINEFVEEMQFQRLSIGSKEFIFKIVLPIMQEIGVMVSKGKYSITQEHIVSSIIRDQLSKITYANSAQSSETFALATPEGNLHELAILIAEVICKINRIPTSYLGAAHPAQCLGEAVSALKCQTIVMGVLSSDQWDYEKNIIPYLTKLDKSLSRKTKIILGGGWKLSFPKFTNITEVKVVSNFEEFDDLLARTI
ncbi:MAG: MerR family transcriptional regulator [Bdellovibrionales bacterium]|nr:MerR family transcriptional regulator [Bdellovibrionales bacterium]